MKSQIMRLAEELRDSAQWHASMVKQFENAHMQSAANNAASESARMFGDAETLLEIAANYR